MNWKRFDTSVSSGRALIFVAVSSLLLLCGFYYFQTFTPVSYETLVFNGVTGPTISPMPTSSNPGTNCRAANTACAIQNTGTASHLLSYCIVGGSVSGLTIELEGSNDTSNPPQNWIQISNQDSSLGGNSGCGVLEAAGYFQFIRANLITLTGTNPQIDAWYSGVGNAIPGGGIIIGQKASQPVTLLPDSTFSSTALKSTGVTISTVPAVVDEVSAGNPNTSVVFITLFGTSPSSREVYQIAASGSRDIEVTRGISLAANGAISCATAVNGVGDPTTGCTVVVHYKPLITVNTQVNSGGIVKGTEEIISP